MEIYGWCLIPSHLHIICRAVSKIGLTDILRDFKKYTSKAIVKQIKEGSESRREWMLKLFSESCSHLKREQKYKVWQDGNNAKEIFSNNFFNEKLEYIHNNPVKEMIVEKPEDYIFSSARNYFVSDYKSEPAGL